MGIASFIISLITGVLMLVIVGVAGYLEMSTEGGLSEDSPAAALVGLGVIATGLVVLLGLGFGLAGLCQSDRRKPFAIVGVVINAIIIACTAGLIVLGSMAE